MIMRYFSAINKRAKDRKRDQQPEPTLDDAKGLHDTTWEMMDRLAEHLDARMRLRGLNSAYILSYFLGAVFGVKDIKADVMALPRVRLELLYNDLHQVITYAELLGMREQGGFEYDDLYKNMRNVYYFMKLRERIDQQRIIDVYWVDELVERKSENN